jgi:HK97 family phage portal protein
MTRVAKEVSASRGERALAGLWPAGIGHPGGWSSNRMEQARHYRHWVYVGVSAIANEVARANPNVAFRLPANGSNRGKNKHYQTLRGDWPPGRTNEYTCNYHKKGLGNKIPGVELEPAAPDHPLVRLLANPNGPDTGPDFWFELAMFEQLTGNAYVWVIPNGLGLPSEMWVIPSQWVFPVAGNDALIDYYAIRPFGAAGGRGQLTIPAREIIHIKNKNPLHKIDGMSALQAAAEWVDTVESAARAQWMHFKQGAFPGLHVDVPGDPDEFELERLYANFTARFSGELNMDKPIITANGTKVKRLTMTPAEMNYIQSAEAMRDSVLAVLRVPKGVVGLEPAGDNISAYAPLRQFCRFCISPILMRLAATFTEKLASRYPGQPVIWYADPTPDDPAQVNADIMTDLAANAIDGDEVRVLRGRAPRGATGKSRVAPKR